MSPRRVIIVSLVVAFAVVAGLAVASRYRTASAAPAATAQAVAVAAERDFRPLVIAQGTIRLLAGARIVIGAQASGVVASLPVTEGSEVRAGEVVALLDTAELSAKVASADAHVSELAAAEAQSDSDLGRTTALERAGGATLQELTNARTTLATARARLAGARADRDLARIELGYATIRSPIDGIVASVSTHEGETVAASFAAPAFMTVVSPSRIECVALVDETDIARVRVGDPATFTVDAYPSRDFSGTVSRIAPDASIVGGVVDYEVTVRLTGDRAGLKPQMTTSVSIAGPARSALVVPTAAVRQSASGTYVWRRRLGRAERTSVRIGARQTDLTEIVSGIARGDTVLTAGFPDQP